MARSRRGQAELIAATIAIAVFVLVVVFMILSITSAGRVSTSALADRARFENERQLEKLAYIYDPNYRECIITNAGAVEIKIVRVWKPDGTVYTPSVLEPIKPGERLPITDWNNVEYIVTARGNVFPVKSRCQELMALSAAPQSGGASGGSAGTPPITSSNVITGDIYINVGSRGGILCSYDNNLCYVAYNRSGTWLVNDGTKWTSTPSGVKVQIYGSNSDLSGDGINELIMVQPDNYAEVQNFGSDQHLVNLTFANVVQIDSDTDVIYVYYMLVILASQRSNSPHDFGLSVTIALSSGTNNAYFTSLYESFAVTKGSTVVMVLQGSVTIPRNAYQSLQQALTQGVYSLSLLIQFTNPSGKGEGQPQVILVRLQQLAVSGAKIVWQQSLQG